MQRRVAMSNVIQFPGPKKKPKQKTTTEDEIKKLLKESVTKSPSRRSTNSNSPSANTNRNMSINTDKAEQILQAGGDISIN